VIYFLTDVAGLSAAAGGIYLVSKALDAVCDPLIGALSDRTVSRWGRHDVRRADVRRDIHPAVYRRPPARTARAAYYLVVYCLWSVGFTLTVMPYQSVVALLSDNRQRRNVIVAVGKLVSAPVGLIVAYAHQLVDALGGGDTAAGWQRMIGLFAVIVAASMWVCAYSIRRFDTREIAQQANANPEGRRYTLKERSTMVLGNKALLMLVIAFGTNNFADTCLSSTQNYYAKYVLEDMGFISAAGAIATALTVPIFIAAPFLTKRLNKRDIFKVATLIHIVFPIVLLLFGPGHETLILVTYSVARASGMLCNIIAFMMLPDCVDFGYKLSGIVSAGLVASTFTFSNKLCNTLGGFLSSAVLDLVGFEANTVQTPLVLTTIVLCMSIPTIISDVASYAGMALYPIQEHMKKE
jgi:GPH family glycoside/pentoside/hexuronide:cation symporter